MTVQHGHFYRSGTSGIVPGAAEDVISGPVDQAGFYGVLVDVVDLDAREPVGKDLCTAAAGLHFLLAGRCVLGGMRAADAVLLSPQRRRLTFPLALLPPFLHSYYYYKQGVLGGVDI